jgi:cytochrome o ubiquinol oxidase subunit 3
MMDEPVIQDEHRAAEEHAADSTVMFGFWMYLMSDFVLFASLFATFAVLRGNTFGGVAGNQIFSLPFVLGETLLLLTSSFTCGLSLLAARAGKMREVFIALDATALLGASFVAMEIYEFSRLISEGNGPSRSGFLSAYFTLVGTHGLHVTIGLIWMVMLMCAIVYRGLSRSTLRKLVLLSLFWHFLDIVWIFIFTIVYLMGVV